MRVEQQSPNRNVGLSCSLFGYSRQAYYQRLKEQEKDAFQEELIVQEVLRYRKLQKRIGARKLYGLMHNFFTNHGINMGRDAFFNTLRANALLVRIRKRKSITTDSKHPYRKYANLIKEFIPLGPNQLWVSDITYINIGNGFGYLNLITDAFSRKIVGFCLSKTLSAKGTIWALKQAIKSNPNFKQLIHHSDRGVQYCCTDYVAVLKKNEIMISMTENGDPLENAIAERVNGILKTELLEKSYTSFEKAQIGIAMAINTYNYLRPHNSISNMTPIEVHCLNNEIKLKRLWKNYFKTQKKEVFME